MKQPPRAEPAALTISVVVPVWNGRAHLAKCLEALAASSRQPNEIVVVDDGSDDDSAAVARAHGCQVVRVANGPCGPATARNHGVSASGGEVVVFIDCDVAVHPNTLERIEQKLLANPDACGVFGSYDNEPTERGLISGYRNLMHHYVHQQSAREASTFWAGCGAIRREAFLVADGFDETYRWASIEDIEFGVRLRRSGRRILLCPEIQATHRKHWSFWQMVHVDIFRRAVPWTKLLLSQGSLPNDLNLRGENRISAIAAWLLLLMLVSVFATSWSGVAALLPLGVLLACNHGLYRLFFRQRGLFFSLGAIGLHWFHYCYTSASFGLVVLASVMPSMTTARTEPQPEAPPGALAVRD